LLLPVPGLSRTLTRFFAAPSLPTKSGPCHPLFVVLSTLESPPSVFLNFARSTRSPASGLSGIPHSPPLPSLRSRSCLVLFFCGFPMFLFSHMLDRSSYTRFFEARTQRYFSFLFYVCAKVPRFSNLFCRPLLTFADPLFYFSGGFSYFPPSLPRSLLATFSASFLSCFLLCFFVCSPPDFCLADPLSDLPPRGALLACGSRSHLLFSVFSLTLLPFFYPLGEDNPFSSYLPASATLFFPGLSISPDARAFFFSHQSVRSPPPTLPPFCASFFWGSFASWTGVVTIFVRCSLWLFRRFGGYLAFFSPLAGFGLINDQTNIWPPSSVGIGPLIFFF